MGKESDREQQTRRAAAHERAAQAYEHAARVHDEAAEMHKDAEEFFEEHGDARNADHERHLAGRETRRADEARDEAASEEDA